MCPSCRLSEHCQLIKTLVETVDSLKKEVQQLKLFPPTRGNPDVVGKDHDQGASGVNSVSGVESGVETEPAPSKAVTNGGASAERSWATVVGRRGNQQRSGSGRRGKRGNSSRAGSHWNYRTHQDRVNQSQGIKWL